MRALLASLALALFLASGCVSPALSGMGEIVPAVQGSHCPDPHFHATFAIFIPASSGPERVDFASPRDGQLVYYDFPTARQGKGATRMSVGVHMHQTGQEVGSAALGPSQLHMEQSGICVSVTEALESVEVGLAEGTLRLWGGHAQADQEGTWTARGDERLRFWVESRAAQGWAWTERAWADVRGYQLQDGEALLVAFGDYTDSQVATMKSQVPAPMSRVR